MKILFIHPTGNQNVREAAKGLQKAGLLGLFVTSIAVFRGTVLYRVGKFRPFSELHKRVFDAVLHPLTKVFPFKEGGRLFSSKFGFNKLIKHEKGFFCVDSVYRSLDKKVSNRLKLWKQKYDIGVVYGYEDGCAYSFEKARVLNMRCIYDLPTGYWRAARDLLKSETERRPEWADTITGFYDSGNKLKRKDTELLYADTVIVASTFTADTLKYCPNSLPPVKVIPYGFPEVFDGRIYPDFNDQRKIKLLFVGKLSQQKGIADLFEAVNELSNLFELTLIGAKANRNIYLESELKKHSYLPPLPHPEVLQQMRQHDILIFPSLFDGFGLVMTEAMSQGTPVIATERSAGPDLIKHGRNGWLFRAGDACGLKTLLLQIAEQPLQISTAGKAAMETARQRPWAVYGRELAEAIKIFS
ncbi:MAG: glycosyltransferase family 4 protein [Paludibacter sp.]|nr:glycosyltransferase family 4 protein [Paludibacter sp.]